MGNCLLNTCPIKTAKFLSWSIIRVNSLESVTDTALLCDNSRNVVTNFGNDDTPSALPTRPSSLVERQLSSTSERTQSQYKNSSNIREYVNFPFLTDDELAVWIVHTRFMFIMRGPSGSGKSYVAECIRTRFPATKICSADNFWYLESDGQEYQFDRSRLDEAHQWCQNLARQAAEGGESPLVIDNTNIRSWTTRYYTDLAREFGYTVIMVSPQTPWRFDTDALAMRNVHFVGPDVVEAMVRNFEPVFPLYYGLVWPSLGVDSGQQPQRDGSAPVPWPCGEADALLDWAWGALNTVLGLPDVRIHLANAFGLSDRTPTAEILRHWQSATRPAFGGHQLQSCRAASRPHITLKYAGYGRGPGAHYYGLSGVVSRSLLGQLFTVQVTGLYVSVRTVGVRVRLPLHDPVLRQLWASDDQAVLSTDSSSYSDACDAQTGQPARPLGCRAHVTLALAPGVSAAETGLDLLRVVDAELADRPGEHVAVVPHGSVRRVTVRQPASSPADNSDGPHPRRHSVAPPGHEFVYVLDLDSPQHHRVLFAGAY